MALLSCYECGTQISSLAPACPHCGAPAGNSEKAPVARTVAREPAEREILREGGVLVTSRRFVVGQTTYAIRGVTSVAIVREFTPGTRTGNAAIGCGLVLLITGVVALLAALMKRTALDSDDMTGPMVFAVVGLSALVVGYSNRKAAQNAFQFVVRMRSASGEQQVYVSRDEALVRRIVAALTAAIST
jgi:hypothetical protein